MAECIVDDCTLRTEPGTTYEEAHRVMERHYWGHVVTELRAIGEALRGAGQGRPSAVGEDAPRGAPAAGAGAPNAERRPKPGDAGKAG